MNLVALPSLLEYKRKRFLLPELTQRHVLLCVFLHNLRHRHLKVFLCHVYSPLPQSKHSRLRAHSLTIATKSIRERETNCRERERERSEGKKQFTFSSAPEAPFIFSAIFFRSIPRIRFIFLEWIFKISQRDCKHILETLH